MTTMNKRLPAFLSAVVFLGCAGLASAADDANQKLADAREFLQQGRVASAVSSIEVALPSLVASQDYWSASRGYFQLAVARGRQNDKRAACAALSKSLENYRNALIRDGLSLEYFGDMASDGSEGSDRMKDVSARLGCTGSWSAASIAGGKTR